MQIRAFLNRWKEGKRREDHLLPPPSAERQFSFQMTAANSPKPGRVGQRPSQKFGKRLEKDGGFRA